MNPHEPKSRERIDRMAADGEVDRMRRALMARTAEHRYSYNFSWLGRPIIQYPEDLAAMQEIVWRTRPDLIVETGIAHGGSLVFYASMLELTGHGRVLGIDVDIRARNREAIEAHPLARRITMLEGSSVDPAIVAAVRRQADEAERVLVVLDSDHTEAHVLEELRLYGPAAATWSCSTRSSNGCRMTRSPIGRGARATTR
jgi:cephalosporin hydroxylase